MGLKYDLMLIRAPMDTIVTHLLKHPKAIDETAMLLIDQQSVTAQLTAMDRYMHAEPNTRNGDDLNIILHRMDDTPELHAYKKRTENALQVHLIPLEGHPDWTICGYFHMDLTSAGMFGKEGTETAFNILGFYVHLLAPMGVDVYFVSYHHGSNDGDVFCYTFTDPKKPTLVEFPHTLDESEQFELYVARIARQTHSPLVDLHTYLSNLLRFTWHHHIRFELQKSDTV